MLDLIHPHICPIQEDDSTDDEHNALTTPPSDNNHEWYNQWTPREWAEYMNQTTMPQEWAEHEDAPDNNIYPLVEFTPVSPAWDRERHRDFNHHWAHLDAEPSC